jgi:putative transposase
MIRAYKYRIYPNKKQQELLVKHFGCVRFLYNWGLDKKNKSYQNTGKSPSCFDLIKELKNMKSEYEWLREVNSQSLQMAFRNLDNAFQRFFKKQSRYPKFKKKFRKQSCQFPQHSKVDFENNILYVAKFREGIKCKFHRKFDGKIRTVIISMTSSGKYFASITVENNEELPVKCSPERRNSIGVDLGIKHFATLSTSEKVDNPRHLKRSENKLRRKQRQLSKKKKGSSNRNKARKQLAKMHEKISNQRKDFLHKLSKRLIDENQAVCLEDLNVSGMIRNHKLAKCISDVGWRTFRTFLDYKSDWYGKHVLTIGRFDPSSKMCDQCGYINNKLLLKDRHWTCNCGAKHDRDILAARNILNFAFCTPGQGEIHAFGEDVRLGYYSKQPSMN